MYTIYCIEDINDLKYVGSTKQTLDKRFQKHKTSKKIYKNCSSQKLDLDNCKMYSLETGVSKKNKKERERYWINEIDCVNERKLNFNKDEYIKNYNRKNKDKIYEKRKDYYKRYYQENSLFSSKRVTDGCYEFIKMLEEY